MGSNPPEWVAIADAWTTVSTWPVFWSFALIGLVCLAVRLRDAGSRLGADGEAHYGLAIALALFALALTLRLLLPERTHYTFNDEYEYVEFARRLFTTGRYELNSGPPAGVFLYAVVFRVLGASTDLAFVANIVLGSLTVPLLYWTLRVLGAERALAGVAGLLLAVAPLHVKHSASASLEIFSILFLLLAIGTFVEMLRAPGWLTSLSFAASLFFALTMRVENWALLILLPLLALLLRGEARRPSVAQLAPAVIAVVLAAAYLPGILVAPIRYEPWWKSQLPSPTLLGVNLAFWVGGDLLQHKLLLVLGVVGLVASLGANPRAALFWLGFLALYSTIFVLYGLNVGWVEEAHQPPPWGARGAGHDMFRFNIVLLPAIVFVLAHGILALTRATRELLRGEGAFAPLEPRMRHGILAAGAVLVVGLLLTNGEASSYHPLDFIASHYNRSAQIAEFRFLHDSLRSRAGSILYVLPPAEGFSLGEIEVRPIASLPDDRATGSERPGYVYVTRRQLAVPRMRRAFEELRTRYGLVEIERREDGNERFFLFAIDQGEPRRSATRDSR